MSDEVRDWATQEAERQIPCASEIGRSDICAGPSERQPEFTPHSSDCPAWYRTRVAQSLREAGEPPEGNDERLLTPTGMTDWLLGKEPAPDTIYHYNDLVEAWKRGYEHGRTEPEPAEPPEGSWGWALVQLKAGQRVTNVDLSVGNFSLRLMPDQSFRFGRDNKWTGSTFDVSDFDRTDWRLAE